MIKVERQNFSFNEINALANCNFLKSGGFAADFDLNDVFTQPRTSADTMPTVRYHCGDELSTGKHNHHVKRALSAHHCQYRGGDIAYWTKAFAVAWQQPVNKRRCTPPVTMIRLDVPIKPWTCEGTQVWPSKTASTDISLLVAEKVTALPEVKAVAMLIESFSVPGKVARRATVPSQLNAHRGSYPEQNPETASLVPGKVSGQTCRRLRMRIQPAHSILPSITTLSQVVSSPREVVPSDVAMLPLATLTIFGEFSEGAEWRARSPGCLESTTRK